jgi:hypothetical protein
MKTAIRCTILCLFALAFLPACACVNPAGANEAAAIDVSDQTTVLEGEAAVAQLEHLGVSAPTYSPKNAFSVSYDHVSVSATTTWKMWKAPRLGVVDYVVYNNPTGLAADFANYYTVELLDSATIMASWSTCKTDAAVPGNGALSADTFVEVVKSGTAANLRFAAADVLSLSAVKTGTQTLPVGRVVVFGHYLQ